MIKMSLLLNISCPPSLCPCLLLLGLSLFPSSHMLSSAWGCGEGVVHLGPEGILVSSSVRGQSLPHMILTHAVRKGT